MERQTVNQEELDARARECDKKKQKKGKNFSYNIYKKNLKNVEHRHKSQSKAVCQELIEETWISYERELSKRRRTCAAGKVDYFII